MNTIANKGYKLERLSDTPESCHIKQTQYLAERFAIKFFTTYRQDVKILSASITCKI